MSKEGEKAYLRNIGDAGRRHAFDKPFSDPNCGGYLMDMGHILSLLPPPPGRLLDLGVGTGWTSVFFARRGYDVLGQDIAEDAIELAETNKARHGLESLEFIASDYESLSFENAFDCAVFYDSLHHAVNVLDALRAVYRALKPGGTLVALEPGVGHAVSAPTRKAVEAWDVTERDMPPALIIRSGRAVGFRHAQVYLRITAPIRVLPHASVAGLRVALRHFKCWLPGYGRRVSNITVLTK